MTQLEEAVLNKFRDFRVAFEALCDSRYGTIPTASATSKGGIIVGGGLSMIGDTLTVTMQGGTDNDADISELDGKIAALNDSITVLDVNLNTALAKIDQLGSDITFNDTSDIDELKSDIVLIESRLDDFAYQLDNATANIDSSASEYTLPTASETQKGGIIVGGGLSMIGDTLTVTMQGGTDNDADIAELDGKIATLNDSITALDVNLNTALTKIDQLDSGTSFGDTSDIDELKSDIVLIESRLDDFAYQLDNVTANVESSGGDYSLPTASTVTKGGIIVGGGLSMVGDTLTVTVTGGGLSCTAVILGSDSAAVDDGQLWYDVGEDGVPMVYVGYSGASYPVGVNAAYIADTSTILSGSPTFSGNLKFTGNPTFSGTPKFTNTLSLPTGSKVTGNFNVTANPTFSGSPTFTGNPKFTGRVYLPQQSVTSYNEGSNYCIWIDTSQTAPRIAVRKGAYNYFFEHNAKAECATE